MCDVRSPARNAITNTRRYHRRLYTVEALLLIHPLIPIHRAIQSRDLFGWHDLRTIFLIPRLESQHRFPVVSALVENPFERRLPVFESHKAIVAVARRQRGGEDNDVAFAVLGPHAVAVDACGEGVAV